MRQVQTASGTLRTGTRVSLRGFGEGTVTSVSRPTRTGRVVIFIEWDDMAKNVYVQRNGITFITRPHLDHHWDIERLQII